LENEDKTAKILVIFIIAIFAFGLSNCVALLSQGINNSEFSNLTEDNNNNNNNSSNIFELNTNSKNESPQNYVDKSNTNNNNNYNNEDNSNDIDTELDFPQENTQIETNDEDS